MRFERSMELAGLLMMPYNVFWSNIMLTKGAMASF